MDFIEKAFAALPGVATSPLAFVAYLAAVMAWAAIAWRVNRNRQLLQHLHKLPEKARLEALRMEMGAVRLKSGLSPEQWIRSRIHLFVFLGFAILGAVVIILFTVSVMSVKGTVKSDLTLYQPGQPAAEAALSGGSDIRFASLEVQNAYDGSGSQGIEVELGNYSPAVTLDYSYGRTEQGIQVRPEMPYLTLLERGGPIRDLFFSDSPFKWQFPKLSIKAVNNTNRTLLLTEIVVNVTRSEIDSEPVLVIPYSYDLTFQNEGWGKVNNPRADFGIADARACGTPALERAPRPISVSLASFDQASAPIPVRLGENVPMEYEGQEDVCVHGVMKYTTDGGEPRELKFQAKVVIGEGGFGGAEEPSYFYNLFLEAGKAGYSKPVSISQSIQPGDADHFVLRIASDKSAKFDLDLSLKDAGGKVLPLQTVHLDLFVPRSQAGYAAAKR